jgi:hypothetical protein
MKQFILIICLLSGASALMAQENKPDSLKYWKVGGLTSLNMSQVSLNNWSAGGKNSIAGTFILQSHFNYKKEKVSWDNNFDLGYGLTQQGDDNPIKTEDKIQFASKYGYAASKYWYYSALVDFKTQMDAGYKDPPVNSVKISELMAPAYLTMSLGMDFKRSENFSVYISPVTTKMTMVLADSLSSVGAYGVSPGDNIRTEYGAYVKMVAKKKDLIKNVDFSTKAEFFSNLATSPQNIDVNWETTFNMKVNEYLSAILSFTMLYDDDTKYVTKDGVERGARVQLKQLFGFGLSYKFGK